MKIEVIGTFGVRHMTEREKDQNPIPQRKPISNDLVWHGCGVNTEALIPKGCSIFNPAF